MFPNIVNLKLLPVELAYSLSHKDPISLSIKKEINNKVEEIIERHCLKKQGVRIRSPYGCRTFRSLKNFSAKKESVSQTGCIKIALPFSGMLRFYHNKCQYVPALNNHLEANLNNISVYVVTNSSDELVSVASRALMYRGKGISIVDLIIDFYYRYCVLDKYNLTNVVGFVFMSYEDANLFLRTVSKDCYEQDKKVAVQQLTLGEACKVFVNPPSGIKFRFIPSSKELQKLFFIYQNGLSYVNWHADQKLTPNSYLGMPVYIVSNKWVKNTNWAIPNSSLCNLLSYDLAFFTYLDALKFCNIVENLLLNPNAKVAVKPSITLFNFEEILFHLKDMGWLQKKVRFFPPYSIYHNEKLIFAKLQQLSSHSDFISWEYLLTTLHTSK
nr:hypothetical protein [Cyanidiaceae sp.]